MEPRSIPLAYLLLAVLVTAAPQHTWGADSRPDILPIVSRAAGDDEAATEKALDELADMGATGMARLRAIEADTTRYTEKQRRQATLAYNRLTDMMAPEKRDSYRAAGEVAFTAANYDLMARKYARIAVLADANVEDCLWNGHARQLAGRWKSAAEAYRLALARVEEMIDNPPDPRAPNPLGGGGKRRLSGRNTSNMRALLTQHAALALLIGKILRYECSDPAGAAGVFASASTRSPDINRPLDKLLADCVTHVEPSRTDQKRPIDFSLEYIMQCLRQVPACMEQSGRSHEAFAAWTRACAVGMLRDRQPGLESVSAMARLLARIKTPQPGRGRGPGEELQPMPRTPWLIMLTPDSPATTLKLDDPATRARSYHHGSLDTPHWKFAICPPPGKEFATVTFACDIEQLNVRYGGQFACAALVGDLGERLVHVGDISWKNKTAGREMIKRTFNMPASTRMLSVTTGSRKDYFKVWELKINATFRPAGKPGAGAKPTARIRQELLPTGGKCTRNGKPYPAKNGWSALLPGRYTYAYTMRGRNRTYLAELDLKPNHRYDLFVNLESPFTRRLTNLAGLSARGSIPDATLVKLPDGRWLTTYGRGDGKIMLAASKDLATWTKPWPLPGSAFFHNLAPTAMIDDDGTIHLAYFSNRLNLESAGTAGYRLWMMHSKNARTWSPPRIIDIPIPDICGWPVGAIHMFRTPAGQCRLHWRNYAAVAKSPADIRSLEPINITLPGSGHEIWNPHLAADDDGTMHMVYDNSSQGIFYTRSGTGDQWSDPICVSDKAEHPNASHPLIIRHGGQTALIYSTLGTWLQTGSLTDVAGLTPPLKITGDGAPLNGARPCVTAKGTLTILSGKDTAWTLQAPLNDIFPKLRHAAKQPLNATSPKEQR